MPRALVDWPKESTVACLGLKRWAAWLMSPRRPPVFVRGECRHSPKALVTDESRRHLPKVETDESRPRSQTVAWGERRPHLPKVVTVD